LVALTGLFAPVFAVPAAVCDLTALAGSAEGTMTLEWTAPDPSDGFSAPQGYLVKYATAEINSADFFSSWTSTYTQSWSSLASSGTAESRLLSNLAPGATLYFAAAAIDSLSNYGVWQSSVDTLGAWNTANFCVIFDSSPSKVSGLTLAANNAFVDISWSANPENDIKEYIVESSSYSALSGFSELVAILSPGTTHQDTALLNGNTYYYRVRAKDNTNNTGEYSSVGSTAPWVAMAQPAFSADAAAISSSDIQWAWNLVSNSDGFRVINSTTGENMSGDLAASVTYWVMSGLTPNASGAVVVEAFNDLQAINSNAKILFTFCNQPGTVTSVLTTAKAELTWQNNSNPSYTRYTVKRSTDGFIANLVNAMTLAASTTHQDLGLLEGTTYQYRIWATNNDELPVIPDYIQVSTTLPRIAPAAPLLTSAETWTNDGEVRLTWVASGDDGTTGQSSSYVVKWSTSDITEDIFDAIGVSSNVAATVTFPSTEPPRVLTGLYPGTTYWFSLRARDKVNNYSLIAATKAVSALDRPPQAPANPYAVALGSNSVAVSWGLPSVSGYDDRNIYKVYRATFSFSAAAVNISTFAVAHPTTYYIDTGLLSETTYFYGITCIDKGNLGNGYFSLEMESPFSSFVSTRTLDTVAPMAITTISASQGSSEGKINLSWEAPGDNGPSGQITDGKYRIDYSSDPQYNFQLSSYQIQITTTVQPYEPQAREIEGLTGGVTYYARVWSADEAGNWSAVSDGATAWAQVDITAPATVTSIAISPSWRQISLSWAAPGDDGTSNALSGSYDLRISSYAEITGANWDQVSAGYPYRISWATSTTPGSLQSCAVTGLSNGTTYYFAVKTSDERGNWSAVSSTSPAAAPVNRGPAVFSLNLPADNSVSPTATPVFTWQASSDQDSALGDTLSYTISFSTESSFNVSITTVVAGLSTPTYTPGFQLWEDKTIYWEARAVDADGTAALCSPPYYKVRINVINTAPTAFSLTGPQDSSIVYTQAPELSWTVSVDNDPGDSWTYKVDYSQTPEFTSYASSAGLVSTAFTTPALVENSTYWWRVWSTDGLLYTMSATTNSFAVNGTSEAPNSFALLTPANDERQTSLDVSFSWNSATAPDPRDSVYYNLTYSLDSDFNVAFSTTITGLTQTTTAQYMFWGDNRDYFWKVDAVSQNNGKSQQSAVRKFYTDIVKQTPGSFSLSEPAYGVLISTTLTPWFIWQAAEDPDPADIVRYYIEISQDPSFTGSQPIPTGADTFYQPLTGLLDQSTYYWRVRASGYQGNPPSNVDPDFVFSPTWSFVISMTNNPPHSFALLAPANGSAVDTKTPALSWNAAVDGDLNDSVEYELFISTVSDFSVLTLNKKSIKTNNYSVPEALLENRTYYWRVVAKDLKGLERDCAGIFSFAIPVINKPVPPAGLRGAISSDECCFTVKWSPVITNTDGTAADDLSGYNIYRAVSVAGLSAAVKISFVDKAVLEYTDPTILAGKYFFFVRAIDESGTESANSLILDTSNPERLTLVSQDQEAVAELPAETSSELLAENNKWQKDITVDFVRKTDLEVGKTFRVYDLKVQDAALENISNYEFSVPVTLQFSYGNLFPAPSMGTPFAAPSSFVSGELAVYWFNGVEYIRVGGYMDELKKKVVIRVKRPGEYQLRQVSRATAFGLASIYPSKTFTPGVAPYEKIMFFTDNPDGDKISGKIFDMRGEYIADIAPVGDATATTVILEWDGAGASKGVYIYQIESQKKVVNGTIILAR